jgi:hypothetical protein
VTDLRKHAKGRECQVRYPGICNGDPATTVLAHVRMPGITGIGQKSPDILGSWCCSACHDEADRRTRKLPVGEAQIGFYQGVLRTLYQLVKQGVIKA